MKAFHILFLMIFFMACQNDAQKTEEDQPGEKTTEYPSESARNSMNWPGTYQGIIPCADCPGIKMEVVLDRTEQFIIRTMHLGENGKQYKNKGQIQWGRNGDVVKLNGLGEDNSSFQFDIEKDQLVRLDVRGKRIGGDLKDRYFLDKTDDSVYDKYFRLITLKGKPVVRDKNSPLQIHILMMEDGTTTGFAGCNQFTGEFDKEGTSLSFKRMASTKKMCSDMKHEDDLLAGLSKVSFYSISGGILTLRDSNGQDLMVFRHDFFSRPYEDQ